MADRDDPQNGNGKDTRKEEDSDPRASSPGSKKGFFKGIREKVGAGVSGVGSRIQGSGAGRGEIRSERIDLGRGSGRFVDAGDAKEIKRLPNVGPSRSDRPSVLSRFAKAVQKKEMTTEQLQELEKRSSLQKKIAANKTGTMKSKYERAKMVSKTMGLDEKPGGSFMSSGFGRGGGFGQKGPFSQGGMRGRPEDFYGSAGMDTSFLGGSMDPSFLGGGMGEPKDLFGMGSMDPSDLFGSGRRKASTGGGKRGPGRPRKNTYEEKSVSDSVNDFYGFG